MILDEMDYYETAKEVTEENDRIETDVHITGWQKKLRIRALSFEQMENINKKATIHKSDNPKLIGTIDSAEWTYWTIVEGVIIPRFTIAQSRLLADNNGVFVRQLADEIWELGRISKRAWDAFIDEQKKLSQMEKTGNPADGDEDDQAIE